MIVTLFTNGEKTAEQSSNDDMYSIGETIAEMIRDDIKLNRDLNVTVLTDGLPLTTLGIRHKNAGALVIEL